MASVESFANYLNSFVHREEHTSLVDFDNMSDTDLEANRVSREQVLRKEVEHWQAMWQVWQLVLYSWYTKLTPLDSNSS